jgi:tetratricopeptide (TPR) repeat protein
VASNSRIDDLRRRLDRDPQSRLFAQLAEELRKEGDLAEAIQVAREGLKSHANYPSARLTLGRALMDTGDTTAAQRELEAAVQGAPDNILAGRLLAECLETEGKLEEAAARYRTTLGLSAGDRQIAGKLEVLEQRIRTAASTPATGPEAAPPIPLAAVESDMELESAFERPAPFVVRRLDEDEDVFDAADSASPAPIPLVDTNEEFELERPYDALAARVPVPMPTLLPEDLAEASAPAPPLEAPPAEAAAPEPAPDGTPDLNSSTLAELYFNQGFTDQAIDVYRRLAEREPANDRVQARLLELEALQRHLQAEEPAVAAAPAVTPAAPSVVLDPAARRAALERTIARLEGLQAAFRKG